MKYLKTTVYEFILILIFTLIYTILYYFNITSNSFNNALKIISFILIFVLTGIRIGRLSNKKGVKNKNISQNVKNFFKIRIKNDK